MDYVPPNPDATGVFRGGASSPLQDNGFGLISVEGYRDCVSPPLGYIRRFFQSSADSVFMFISIHQPYDVVDEG